MNSVTDSNSIEIENSSQRFVKELSLKEMTQITIANWPLFLVLFVSLNVAGLILYKFKNPYVGKTNIIVNDAQNSNLQAFVIDIIGQDAKTNEAKKSNSSVQKSLEYFKSTDFFSKVYLRSLNPEYIKKINLNERKGLKIWNEEILKNNFVQNSDEELFKVYQFIDQVTSIKIKSDFTVEVNVMTDKKELTLFLSNLVAQVVQESLIENEKKDLDQAYSYLQNEKSSIDTELSDLNKKMKSFNEKPENLMAISSKDKVAEYLSELLVRKNETLLKISENNKVISSLSAGSTGRKESQLYGNNGRVQSLNLENELMRSKLSQLQTAIDRVSKEAQSMPIAAQMYSQLEKQSDQQISRYKNISEALSKLEAMKLSLISKYEIIEKVRYEKVQPFFSLTVLFALTLILTQLMGSLIIYIKTIWDTNLVTAESSRNVVVIDSHSIDPRVIIENSKIKFRLKSSQIAEDPEKGETKKLGFDFKKSNDLNN